MRRTTKPLTDNPFLARAIDEDPTSALKAFENGLAVSLIATPRDKIRTCHVDEDLTTVVARNRADKFDFLPVIEPLSPNSPDRIVGLVELWHYSSTEPTPDGSIGVHMQPLSEKNLIGADAGILAFVRDADQHRLRLVVSGREISGLVSLSDLQKLPARAALFAVVTQLEMVMADAIRREFGGGDDWLERLPPTRQQKLRNEIEKSQADDTFVDALLFTQFVDKITILAGSPRFSESNFEEGERELRQIMSLRDHLAHANDYAATPEDAILVCITVRLIDKWRGNLLHWFSGQH